MRFFILITFGLLIVFSPWNQISSVVLAASDDATIVINECKKRTGLSDSACLTLIKKYMTPERCQEYTDLSAKECEKKIASLKEDPKFQEKKAVSVPSPQKEMPIITHQSVSEATTLRERILEAKREKERRFNLLQQETRALIEYLKQNGQATGAIETALEEFEQKKKATLLAYDQYQSIAESLRSSSEAFQLEGPRLTVLRVLSDATSYYRMAVLKEVQKALAMMP